MNASTLATHGRTRFMAALEAENERLRAIPPRGYFTRNVRNDALAAATDGLDLDDREWRLLEWFLTWDSQDALAAIIRKAREQDISATGA